MNKMPSFGVDSQKKLNTCHHDLQKIANLVIQWFDFSVIEGERSLEEQQKMFLSGRSKIDGITRKGKHNCTPSMAFDVVPYIGSNYNPYPLDSDHENMKCKKLQLFALMAGYFFMASEILYEHGQIRHKLRWGGDWDGDKNLIDQTFDDLPHFEMISDD